MSEWVWDGGWVGVGVCYVHMCVRSLLACEWAGRMCACACVCAICILNLSVHDQI